MSLPSREPSIPIENRLLAALPRSEYDRLLPELELTRFPRNRILYEAGDATCYVNFLNRNLRTSAQKSEFQVSPNQRLSGFCWAHTILSPENDLHPDALVNIEESYFHDRIYQREGQCQTNSLSRAEEDAPGKQR